MQESCHKFFILESLSIRKMASTIQNRPIQCVDIHHHIFPASLPKGKINARMGWRTPEENLPWSPEKSLATMDKMGIDLAILSYPAGMPFVPPSPACRDAARKLNVEAASICKDHPGRFGFFACLPDPRDAEGALQEISYALDHLHADGVSLSSSYGDGDEAKYIGHDVYDPMWEELDRRQAVVFLHGAQLPSSTPYPHEFLGVPISEVPNETYKAASHLVVSGKKRRFPNVKIILSHFGGSAPFLAPRVAVLSNHMGCGLSPEEIMEDFKTFYYDTALSSHESNLEMMLRFVGKERILFGTDYPAVSSDMASWYKKQLDEHLGNDELHQIMAGNATNLFPKHLTA
ncbi:amidohydrolase 2 [Panus rudis PR-1116 ss-1]|nr:amidohydrolase 2 [Panus rudis PR-1116 ss-1]